jgi:hypothetical protein
LKIGVFPIPFIVRQKTPRGDQKRFPVKSRGNFIALPLRRRNRLWSRIRAALCVIAQRHAGLSVFMLPMPRRRAQGAFQ